MKWLRIRETYPNQWLIVEALTAHTSKDSLRVLEDIAVIEPCK